jgi:hypothetical protein
MKTIILFAIYIALIILVSFLFFFKNEPDQDILYGTIAPLMCSYGGYRVEEVDEIQTSGCFAITNQNYYRNVDQYKQRLVSESINNNMTPESYFQSIGWNCTSIKTYGTVYCLRNHSKCLILEGEGVCNIVNIET